MPRRSKKSDNSHDHINRRAESFSFVGRQDEIKIITDKFVKEDNVSIAFIFGPAKTGKDRVALEIGHELVKIYDADRAEDPESDILHAYAVDVSKYEASGTKLEDIIKEELKEHHGMSGDLNSFLKRSKEYHLVILNNCQHYSKDSGKQSEFLDALGDLTKTHDKILFIVTSRSIFKMSSEHVHKHILWPLSPPDVASLLRSIAGKVDNLEEHLDEIVKFAYPLPECIIQIANSLKDKEYTPKEMVEVLERSTLSICSDEAYSNKERLNVQIKKDFVNLTDIMSEFLSTLSFMGGDTISPEVIAERMRMTEAEVKQDFLLRCERHGLMTRSQDTYARAEGSKDLSISLIGDEKHMEPELKNDELSCQLLTRFRVVGLSVTKEPELELDKHQKKVQDLRDKLLIAVRPSRQGDKLKHLEKAINIATEILKTFVTERECIKFKKEASALVEQSLKDSQSDAKNLSPETKQDKMPVQVDDCSSTPGQNDSCGEYHGETNGRLISGPISSSGEQQDTLVLQPQDDVQSQLEIAKGLQPTESAGKSEFSTDTTGDQSTRLKITNQDNECQVKPSLTHRNPRNVTSANYPVGTGNRLCDYGQTDDVPSNGVHGMLPSVTSNDSTIPPSLNESVVPCGAAQSYNSVHTLISSKTYLENGRVDSIDQGNGNIGEQYNTYETLTQIKAINDKPREVDEIEGPLPNSVTEQPTRNHQQTPRAPSNRKVMTHNGYPVIVDSKCVQTSLNFNPTNHKCDIIPKHVQHVPGTPADRQVYQDSPAVTGLREWHYHKNQRENEDLFRQYGDQIDQARRLQGEHQNDNQTSCVDQSSQREHLQRTPMDHFYEGTPADRQGYYQGSPAFTGSTDSHYLRKQRQNGDLYRQYGDQTDQARRLQREHQYDNQTSCVDQPSGHEHLQRKPVDHFYRGGNGIPSAIPRVSVPRLNLDQLNDPSVNELTWKDGLQHQHMTEHQHRNDNISSRASPPVLKSSADTPGFSYDMRPLQTHNDTMMNGTRQLEEQTVALRIKESPQGGNEMSSENRQENLTGRQRTNERTQNQTQPYGPWGIVPPDNRFLYEQGMPYTHGHASAHNQPNGSAGHERVPAYLHGTSTFQANRPEHAVAYTGSNGAAPAGFLNSTPPHQAHEPDNMVMNAGNTQRETSDSDDDSGVFAKTPR